MKPLRKITGRYALAGMLLIVLGGTLLCLADASISIKIAIAVLFIGAHFLTLAAIMIIVVVILKMNEP